MTPVETVLLFLDRINQGDPDKLSELMTEDHVLIDSLDKVMRGREAMRRGWRSYYAMCPDYRVFHEISSRTGTWWPPSGRRAAQLAGTLGKHPPPGEPSWTTGW